MSKCKPETTRRVPQFVINRLLVTEPGLPQSAKSDPWATRFDLRESGHLSDPDQSDLLPTPPSEYPQYTDRKRHHEQRRSILFYMSHPVEAGLPAYSDMIFN